jgi:hypothetical protein
MSSRRLKKKINKSNRAKLELKNKNWFNSKQHYVLSRCNRHVGQTEGTEMFMAYWQGNPFTFRAISLTMRARWEDNLKVDLR